jgi:uncharacterized protein YoxC
MEAINWEGIFPFMRFLLFIGGVAAVIAIVFVLRNLARLLESTTKTVDELEITVRDMRENLLPIVKEADTTMKQVNVALGRFDHIMEDFESTTKKVAHTAEAASNVVQTPVDFVAGLTTRLMRNWREQKAEKQDYL